MTLNEFYKKLDRLAELDREDQYYAAVDLLCFINAEAKKDDLAADLPVPLVVFGTVDVELALVEVMSNCFDSRMFLNNDAELKELNRSIIESAKIYHQ